MSQHDGPGATPADPLAGLRDIHLPEDPSWWPPAPGWWVLAATLIMTAMWGVRAGIAWHRRRAPRRAALTELAAIEARAAAGAPAETVLAETSALLRRVALVRFADERVAGLTGARWLEFLNAHAERPGFIDGPGASLTTGPYRPHGDVELAPVLSLVRGWVEKNG